MYQTVRVGNTAIERYDMNVYLFKKCIMQYRLSTPSHCRVLLPSSSPTRNNHQLRFLHRTGNRVQTILTISPFLTIKLISLHTSIGWMQSTSLKIIIFKVYFNITPSSWPTSSKQSFSDMMPDSRSSPLPDNGSLARVSAATNINQDIPMTTGE
jgi:hypothetical protein